VAASRFTQPVHENNWKYQGRGFSCSASMAQAQPHRADSGPGDGRPRSETNERRCAASRRRAWAARSRQVFIIIIS